MSAVTSPYGPTEMLSESVYNFSATSRRASGSGGATTGNSDCDSRQYESSSQTTATTTTTTAAVATAGLGTQLQLAASIQQQLTPSSSSSVPAMSITSSINTIISGSRCGSTLQPQVKPRNKRKNFKPISSKMAEISDESDEREDDQVIEGLISRSYASDSDIGGELLDYDESSRVLQTTEVRSTLIQEQKLNNIEVIPMDLSVVTRPPSFEADDDSTDFFRHKFLCEKLHSQKTNSFGTDARSLALEFAEKSNGTERLDSERAICRMGDESIQYECTGNQDVDNEFEEHRLLGNVQAAVLAAASAASGRSFDNMREYAELFAVFGLDGGELVKSISQQLQFESFLNPQIPQQKSSRLKFTEEKEASSGMAPGSPPTPPHTPQSPLRQSYNAANISSSPSSKTSSPNIAGLTRDSATSTITVPGGAQPSSSSDQNQAFLQFLQQNVPNPALVHVFRQQYRFGDRKNSSAVSSLGFADLVAAAADDNEISPTIASLASVKVDESDSKVAKLSCQSISPDLADTLLSCGATTPVSGNGASGPNIKVIESSSSLTTSQQPLIDYSRYVRRYSSSQECSNSNCKDLGCREHFHCLDCSGRVFVKKEEMIRHFKWHKKRDESLQHGFMRYSPNDDCAERHPTRMCPHNRKQTHYHCIHDNCDKVYISTSDVQMHANYHRKDSAIIQEGFQRFRATESCATEHCPFVAQRTTHFHCRRPNCRYTFKNKADMDKHKSYHIKDEQLSRDGFKKFMKNEACPFDACRFSNVCNHIHCIRPQCNYVLHSSGQLFSHKRKHERNDSELAYRKYKQLSGAPSGAAAFSNILANSSNSNTGSRLSLWTPEDLGPQSLSLSINGESSNEGRASPSYFSMDDSLQSGSDLAMDLTSGGSVIIGGSTDVSIAEQHQKHLTSTELAYLMPASIDCSCNLGKDHYHCMLDRCGASLRDPYEIKDHLHDHETQERISDAFFEEGGCEESNCPYGDKEKHYHCTWDNCREAILVTDKPFRRLQHYKIHEYSRQLNLSGYSNTLSTEVTLTHLTNIDAMFRRKRGRPPKNRIIEIWSGTEQPGQHILDSPQAIFTSFKLPKPTPSSLATKTSSAIASSQVVTGYREGSLSPTNGDPVGFSTYNQDLCPDLSCTLRSTRHHHCSQPRCHFSTDRSDQFLMHSKDFHDNVEIPRGFAFYDRLVDCKLPGCQSNRINRHFHCTRPSCGYSFVRYSTIAQHEKQHIENLGVTTFNISNNFIIDQDTKPRIHVKNSAELIDKLSKSIDDLTEPKDMTDTSSLNDVTNKTTVVRAAGTYYPVSGPPNEPALSGAILSMRASVHQESISQLSVEATKLLKAAPLPSSHTLYGLELNCGRPFCKLKRKNHYHCNACNQAFSEFDRLVPHIAKHSAGAILSQQHKLSQQEQPSQHPQQQLPLSANVLTTTNHIVQSHDYLRQLSQHAHKQHENTAQNTRIIQNIQNQIQKQLQQQQQQLQRPMQQQQLQQGLKDMKLESLGSHSQQNQVSSSITRESESSIVKSEADIVAGIKRESEFLSSIDSTDNGQLQQQQQQQLSQVSQQVPTSGFEIDLSHGFHFSSPAIMAAMNQQIALMNHTLPPFFQHGNIYSGAPGLMFAPGIPPGNFLPPVGIDDNPLASLAANLNLSKRSLDSMPDSNSPDAKKQRLHNSMKMLKDEPVPEGYIRFRFNEDCRYTHCGYREHQTHFHCMRQDCGYSFCDKTRFVQHTARHERLDTLMGGDFQQYRANVPCGRPQCAYTSSLGSMQNKASHFHCLKCDFVCTDTNKVVAHRRQHAKLDNIAAAGFQKFTPSQPCGALQCQHSGKQTHYHCLQCQYAVLGLAQMSAHKYRHIDQQG